MLKLKKLPQYVFLMCIIAVAFTLLASASGSGYVASPGSTAGSWSSGSSYACYSEAKTAEGRNSYTYFKDQQSLQSNFSANNNRKLTLYLMEEDFLGSDDHVKTYEGSFSGRKLGDIVYKSIEVSGAIDSSGDNCAELYIKYKVDKVSGDPSTPSIASGLFKYSVGMN